MEPENKKPLTKKALVVVTLLGFFILTAFMPARWIGLDPKKISTYTPLDFNTIKPAEETLKESDENSDGTVTWRELFEANLPEGETLQLEATTPDPKIQKALDDPNNLTASFAKNLMVSSAYIKNNNITDPGAQKAVVDGVTQEEINKTISKKYIVSDISIVTKETPESIKMYGNTLAKHLSEIITKKELSEHLPGVSAYIEFKDALNLQPLKEGGAKIEERIKKIKSMNVPSSAVVYHITVLNTLEEYKDTLLALSNTENDPVRAAIFIEKYPTRLTSTLSLFKTLSSYFLINKISFQKNEAGYLFIKGYEIK